MTQADSDRNEIIEMARQAGLLPEKSNIVYQHSMFEFYIQHFAKLVAAQATAKERELCKKECMEQFELSLSANEKAKRVKDKEAYLNAAIGAKYCFMRIDARGET